MTRCVLVLLLAAAAAPAQFEKAFNAGGGAITRGAVSFSPDTAYAPPAATSGYVGGRNHEGSVDAVVGGDGPKDLYRLSREGLSAYLFECPNGTYVVTLGFAEISPSYRKGNGEGPGIRTFTVAAEGQPVVSDLDIAAEAGGYYGLMIRFRVDVSDGRLDITFTAGLGEPIVAHVHVKQQAPDTQPPAAPATFTARPGFGRNILHWSAPGDADFRGVHVLRATKGSSAYTTVHTSRAIPALFADTAAEPNRAYDYRLVPFDVFGNQGAAGGIESATARDLEAPGIRNYHLTLDPEALRVLDRDPWADVKVPAVFRHAGKSFPVRVRYRGGVTRDFAKKNWKVDFGRPVFEGRREINLQAEFRDVFLLREKIVYDLFQAAGVVASTARYVHLTLNGEELGLYTEVDQVDPLMLERAGRDDDVALYKATGGTLHVESNPSLYPSLYDKKTEGGSGHDDLIAFINHLNQASAADFARAIAEVLEVDAYLDCQAALNWMGSWDSVHVNYYLARDRDLDRWYLVPWDQDTSLGNTNYYNTVQLLTWLPLDYGTVHNPRGQPPTALDNQLLTRMLDTPLYRWMYARKIDALSTGICAPLALVSRLDQAGVETRDAGEADLLRWGWEDTSWFLLGPTILKYYSPLRIDYLNRELPTFRPATGPAILVNEIMAENDRTVKDEAGDWEDWIELYNPGPSPVDISGYFLTDKLDQPTKWMIPASTVVGAGGRLLVWADEEPAEGKYHATFKLSAAGEQVAVFAPDGKTLVDVIHFPHLAGDVSLARMTDGAAFFRQTALPTPGGANLIGGDLPPRLAGDTRFPNAPKPGEKAAVTVHVADDQGVRAVEILYRTTGAFQPLAMFDDGLHGDGYAGDGVFGAELPGLTAGTRVEYYFRAEDTGGHSVTRPLTAPNNTRIYLVLRVGTATSVRIHEFLAENLSGIRDERSEREDWIELLNPGPAAVNAGGLFLTDDLNDPTRWMIPANTTIPAGGTILIWADGETNEGPLHASFGLEAAGEEIGLFDRDGLTLLDSVVFGGQFADVSTGRIPAAIDPWVTFPSPTPGSPNEPAAAGGYLEYRGSIPAPLRPTLGGSGVPRIGGRATFDIARGPVLTSGLFALSTNPLNADIPGLGAVLVYPAGLVFLPFKTDLRGETTMNVPIPSVGALAGVRFYSQAVAYEGATPRLSGGLVVRIGK